MCAGGGEGEGEGEVVEQQTRALGNPCSSFSSSSSSLCTRRGFDKNSTLGSAVQVARSNSCQICSVHVTNTNQRTSCRSYTSPHLTKKKIQVIILDGNFLRLKIHELRFLVMHFLEKILSVYDVY